MNTIENKTNEDFVADFRKRFIGKLGTTYGTAMETWLNQALQAKDAACAAKVEEAVRAEREKIRLMAANRAVWADECRGIQVIPKSQFLEDVAKLTSPTDTTSNNQEV